MPKNNNEEMEEVLGFLMSFTHKALEKNGTFFPVAAAMDANGKIVPVAVYEGKERPSAQEVIASLETIFKESAGASGYRVVAIAFDSRVVDPSDKKKKDAIQVNLEHKEGDAIQFTEVYHKPFLRKHVYGPVFWAKNEQRLYK